ncbi:MAG: hypothetical protein IJV89_03390 [Lentisphaeria bacterium]|nr:hypothetical protein [Lentisphaeria bacterium]
MSFAAIKNYGGVPTLFIDGVPQVEMAYMTYFDEAGSFGDFYRAGYKCFCLCVYFGDQSFKPSNVYTAFAPGIFTEKGKADYSHLEKIVANLLRQAPDAKIFFRVNTSPPKWWEDENPEELNDSGVENQPPRYCPASRKYREQVKAMLRQFIEYLERSSFCDHIFGLQLAGGCTEEWGSFDGMANTGAAARREFALRYPGKSFQSPEFTRFLHIAAGENLCELAKFTRETIKNQWVIGTFFGYLFETPDWRWGNHALQMLLASPDIDFLCSPCSYIHRKHPGYTWPCMVPHESCRKHGKLYFFEYDTRTLLSRFLPDCHPEVCRSTTAMREPVWLGPPTEAESIEHLRMNFVQQMAMGCASWWFDLMGGWYDSPGLIAEMARLKKLAEPFLHDADRTSIAQCAAYMDETASAFAEGDHVFQCTASGRTAISQSGVPVDYYELHDFADTVKRYKCVFFFVTARTAGLDAAEEYCRENHIPYLEFDGITPVTPGDVRNLCIQAGAHCYCADFDAGVWCSCNIAAVIARESGVHTLRLPEKRKMIPLFTDGEAITSDHAEITLKCGEVAAFRLAPK